MKLACSTWMMPGDNFFEKMRRAHEFGFEGVDIRLFDHEVSSEKIKEISDALHDNGLRPSSLVMPGDTFRRSLSSEEIKNAKIEHAKKALEIAAQLGCPTLICPEYGPQSPLPLFDHPKRPTDYEHDLLIEYLTFVDDYADSLKAKALIEPINRYETHFYYTLEDAKNILDTIGSKCLFLVADYYHMNMEEKSIPEVLKSYIKDIRHVHLGDSNRMMPGQGHTDFRSGFMELKNNHYNGFLSLECSISGDPDIEIPRCINFLKTEMK